MLEAEDDIIRKSNVGRFYKELANVQKKELGRRGSIDRLFLGAMLRQGTLRPDRDDEAYYRSR